MKTALLPAVVYLVFSDRTLRGLKLFKVALKSAKKPLKNNVVSLFYTISTLQNNLALYFLPALALWRRLKLYFFGHRCKFFSSVLQNLINLHHDNH